MNPQRLITTCAAIGIAASLGTFIFLTKVYHTEKPMEPLVLNHSAVNSLPHQPAFPATSIGIENKNDPKVNEVLTQKPEVEVVFVLDTTGSMGGLIEGAKKKIWEIARFISQGQPSPKLKIGLIGYRDLGDAYVTKFFDLQEDLDEVYQHLYAFQAEGGGDTPEHVAKALSEAVSKTKWSSSKNTLKIIYLVGDAPPHTDYQDGYHYLDIVKKAKEQGIRINTVRCGNDSETQRYFTEIAQLSLGEYTSIEQSGGMAEIVTPYDKELAALNAQLSSTTLTYGSEEKQRTVLSKLEINMAAPFSVQAERASVYSSMNKTSGRVASTGEGDLLDDVTNKKVDVATLDKAALPKPMQELSPDQRKNFLAQKQKERQDILAKINALSGKRDGYLKAQTKPLAGSFDEKVRDSLKKQAKSVGMSL